MTIDHAEYVKRIEQRWGGEALRDARRNWHDFQELHDDLLAALKRFKHNPFQTDLAGKCHNPDGTLSAYLWKLQEAWNPDRSSLVPLLDFEEHFQKVFLRRGLISYCTLILEQFEKPAETQEGQLVLV